MPEAEARSAVAQPSVFWLVMQVWGEAYTRSLTDIALPALLSPGNIPALAASRRTILKLYSTDADMARIEAAPAFHVLKRYVEVDYSPLDATPGGDKYAAMTAIHRRLVVEAYDERAALVWLLPDTVWADGSLRTVARAASAGKRAVMQAGIRVSKSTALPAVRALLGDAIPAAVDARELVQLALDHMHPYYRAWYWDAPEFNRNPANVFFRTDAGMVVRAFHLHPLMLFPERRVRHFVSTFDDDLPLLACPSPDSVYIAADSDEIFHIDLAEDDWCPRIPMLDGRPSAAFLAKWAWGSANRHHRRFARQPIHVHTAPLTPAAEAVARRSGRIIARAEWFLRMRAFGARALDQVFGFPGGWEEKLAAGERLGAQLRPAPPRWWASLVALLRRHRRSIQMGRALNRFYAWALLMSVARTFGRGVASRGLEIDPWLRRNRRRFPRILRRLLADGLTWALVRRSLFWYVLVRSTWRDQHATMHMLRRRVKRAWRRNRNRMTHRGRHIRIAVQKRTLRQWTLSGRRVQSALILSQRRVARIRRRVFVEGVQKSYRRNRQRLGRAFKLGARQLRRLSFSRTGR